MVAQGRNCPTDVEMNLTEFTDRLKVEKTCVNSTKSQSLKH